MLWAANASASAEWPEKHVFSGFLRRLNAMAYQGDKKWGFRLITNGVSGEKANYTYSLLTRSFSIIIIWTQLVTKMPNLRENSMA